MKQILPIVLLLLATACDRSERVEAPTAAEAERLDDADAMLDNMAANEEGPATEVADPSNN
jgi:hypothetical protein